MLIGAGCVFGLGGPEAVVSLMCSVGVRSVAPQSQGSWEAGIRTAGQRLQATVGPGTGGPGGWMGGHPGAAPPLTCPGADGHASLGGGRRQAGL